ncbi:MAG: methyltransferase domain-containing protein [bacterium]|nr:methyltransferase domain-containing protein [bacterium]
MSARSTRGAGVLEPWLASLRFRHARRALAMVPRTPQAVLDVGCGVAPVFLASLQAGRRCGIDRFTAPVPHHDGITMLACDLVRDPHLPFENASFDAVTMLAVWEHIPTPVLSAVCREVHRCLRDGGRFIITTPAPLGQLVLQPMTWCGLVSKEEITEHVSVMNLRQVKDILSRAGFSAFPCARRFLLGMNQLVAATKGICPTPASG